MMLRVIFATDKDDKEDVIFTKDFDKPAKTFFTDEVIITADAVVSDYPSLWI